MSKDTKLLFVFLQLNQSKLLLGSTLLQVEHPVVLRDVKHFKMENRLETAYVFFNFAVADLAFNEFFARRMVNYYIFSMIKRYFKNIYYTIIIFYNITNSNSINVFIMKSAFYLCLLFNFLIF